jgi:hypothetical protein
MLSIGAPFKKIKEFKMGSFSFLVLKCGYSSCLAAAGG